MSLFICQRANQSRVRYKARYIDTPGAQRKIFHQLLSQMLKFAILRHPTVPSILAAFFLWQEKASALIAAEDTGTLEKTFKTFEEEQDDEELAEALANVASVPARMPKVVDCLRMAHDPFPKDDMCVSYSMWIGLYTEYYLQLLPSHLQV